MDVGEIRNSNEQVWGEMISSISKIREDLVSNTDAIEQLLIELYEKKICLESLDDEKMEFEKKLQTAAVFDHLEFGVVTLQNYRKLVEAWKEKCATISHLLQRIQKEL